MNFLTGRVCNIVDPQFTTIAYLNVEGTHAGVKKNWLRAIEFLSPFCGHIYIYNYE